MNARLNATNTRGCASNGHNSIPSSCWFERSQTETPRKAAGVFDLGASRCTRLSRQVGSAIRPNAALFLRRALCAKSGHVWTAPRGQGLL
jgi:hypothetical protein